MKRRWYDEDPTVSLAISLLQNSDDSTKDYCANYITDKIDINGFRQTSSIITKIEHALKRWYDNNEKHNQAMECLRLSSNKIRKQIALEVIDILHNAETRVK